jgi:hypothetical protein
VIVRRHESEAANDGVEAGRLGRAELVVVEVGMVDHRGDFVERGIGQLLAREDALERAPALVVPKLDAPHIERRAAEGGRRLGIRSEGELGLGVHEAPDEPGAGGPVKCADVGG